MTNLINDDPFNVLPPLHTISDPFGVKTLLDRPFGQSLLDDRWFTWPAWANAFTMTVGDNLPVDMIETDDAIIVKANLPAVEPADIEVEERDGWLSIRAKRDYTAERTNGNWHLQERRYGAWQRTLRLPVAVRGEKASAQVDNGILTVRLPKVDASKSLLHRIKVNWPKLKLPLIGKKEPEVKVIRH